MPEIIKDILYYVPIQIAFYSLLLLPTWAVWYLTSSAWWTLLACVIIGQPLAYIGTVVVALLYPEEEMGFDYED